MATTVCNFCTKPITPTGPTFVCPCCGGKYTAHPVPRR